MADATAPKRSWMMGNVLEVGSDLNGHVRSAHLQNKDHHLESLYFGWLTVMFGLDTWG